ncbi:HAD-like protein [Aaosphaeria arxii CBS 175.79]|uniref:HAD-like protein n=1 Tax=Aaosphaeria arxii CBS 175.79 TaxID=1450172 RepID=A0A6A5XNT4_9PLEO|nr:HAD-like protein [Aaosphaeria arxii CBS 175.79]KAF2014802.1 HAD-like protein [Aaosphaeria arxii CBS 175.79]
MSSLSKLPPPKAILFDIGGVCVISPFQAILDYERAHNIPTGYINHAIQLGPHDTGAWQLIERGDVVLNDAWFASFKAQLSNPDHWSRYYLRSSSSSSSTGGGSVPPVPDIDAKKLFWNMMRTSRAPDPFMYPALKKLGASGRFALGALSNTVAYPDGIVDEEGNLFEKGLVHDQDEGNPHRGDSRDIKDCFDVFVSSAHVGVRKPDPKAYELAVRELDRVARGKGLGGVTAEEVLFLDDIGINLKWAKKSGLRTIKVNLGETKDAVRQLEEQTGLQLLPDNGRAKL